MTEPRTILLEEADRLRLLDLRVEQDALEMLLAGGSGAVTEEHFNRYKKVLEEVNEFKRDYLLEMGEIDESMYDYVFYFDTVAGFVVIEDSDD